ncbi:hypothetical protein [Accumulibacter sp.]|uniref:hypothetical protein n=1 Tax=Accumulibacter sp. TaxID=2053492 RepID=UPI002C263DFB|nr:hypothetical protein [Accumulibacter sp.]HNG16571.1 hypothetical protein [Accumulibacter sp.]
MQRGFMVYPYAMLRAAKTVLAIIALVAIVPLFVLGATGSWRHALHALREYGVAMAWLIVPTTLVSAAILLADFIS